MQNEQKLLLMGPSGGGKTCMRSVIFENYLPRDAFRLRLTLAMESAKVRMLNNLTLNLWDCGGQKEYVTNYLTKQKDYIFRSVGVMLFVFDVQSLSRDLSSAPSSTTGAASSSNFFVDSSVGSPLNATGSNGGMGSQVASGNPSQDWSKSEMLDYFTTAMKFLKEHSPNAKVFILLHKMDLVSPAYREQIFEHRKQEILQCVTGSGADSLKVVFYGTSLWSNSLYLAYSHIVRSLVPHRAILTNELKKIAKGCQASEVALYEKHTFLCLSHVNENGEVDASDSENRTTQISEIVKMFKLSCLQSGTSFQTLKLSRHGGGTVLLSRFTDCTLVLVVCKDSDVNAEVHQLNVDYARKAFLTFLNSKDPVAMAMKDVL